MSKLSENFWIYFLSSVIAFLVILVKICFKSKCSNIKMCSCLEIQRHTEEEKDETSVAV
jgi:hypothetical protein